jgi:hypothetical protein
LKSRARAGWPLKDANYSRSAAIRKVSNPVSCAHHGRRRRGLLNAVTFFYLIGDRCRRLERRHRTCADRQMTRSGPSWGRAMSARSGQNPNALLPVRITGLLQPADVRVRFGAAAPALQRVSRSRLRKAGCSSQEFTKAGSKIVRTPRPTALLGHNTTREFGIDVLRVIGVPRRNRHAAGSA